MTGCPSMAGNQTTIIEVEFAQSIDSRGQKEISVLKRVLKAVRTKGDPRMGQSCVSGRVV